MFKQNPVAWLTAAVAGLTAADGSLEAAHVLSPTVSAYAGVVIAVLTLVVGRLTHNAVTPVANPKSADGRRLVPMNHSGAEK